LGEAARKRLREMGYENVVFKIGDGTLGWIQHGPFDRIIVTAGAPVVPPTLAKQLADDGIMIIPTGNREHQELEIYRKTAQGIQKENAGRVVFVPLVGNEGWK
jgi:protein-L-isoaspartate(D-aspartate) O-methyltransferase